MKPRSLAHTVTRAVVFDLGGVLIDLHAAEARQELIEKFGMQRSRVDALTRSCFTRRRPSITERAMLGQVGTHDYLATFSRQCRTEDLRGIRANRLSVVGSERAVVFSMGRQLQRAGMVCCIFSNTIALHWEKLSSSRHYPSLRAFDHIFASHLIARAKPRQTAFSFVARALKLHPSECLLVDDTPLNVDRAQAAGWRGLLFTDASRLQQDLAMNVFERSGTVSPGRWS